MKLLITIFAIGASLAQAGQWLTFGGNPQRDGWARDETTLTKDNVKSIKVIWKVHVNSELREMNGLTAPVIVENVLTLQGHKDIVVVAGASDTLDAVDIDTGKILWHKQFCVHAKAPAFPVKNGETPEGALMAFKVEEKDGKPILSPAWISRNMNVPEPPIVANGVIFLVASGENALQADSEGHLLTSEQRIKTAPGQAVLYALDAETGKELYNSGNAMPAIAHFSGIAISNGRIFVTTLDSNLYSFGLDDSDK